VPQHITDIFESHPLTQQLQRKRVPQAVKACRLDLNFRGSDGTCESASYSLSTKRTYGRTLPKKQMTVRRGWTCVPQVVHQRVTNFVGQW
jgi:hypothetical protein